MAITFLQQNGYDDDVGVTSTQSPPFGNPNTAGSLLVAYVGYTGNGSTITLSDSQGNTWQSCAARADANGSGLAMQLFYATNVIAGTNSVTATFSSAVDYPSLYVSEYAGAALSAPLDGAATATVVSSTPTAGPITTTGADLVVCGIYAYAVISSAGAGFTSRRNAGGSGLEDLIQTSAGSVSGSWTMSGAAQACALQVAAFKPAATGLATPRRLLLLGCGA